MLSNSVPGLLNYYNVLFTSPVKSYQVNPISNLIFGSAAAKIYSQTVAKKAQSTLLSYLTSMNSTVNTIKSSAKTLTATAPSSSFNKKAVTSSDSNAVTGIAASNADVKTYSITVSKLATGQTNKGQELKTNDATALTQGVNTFTVKSNGKSKTVSFTVNNGETNKNSLDKMAAAINKANTGVTASVVSDAKAGTSYLKLNSTNTGTDSAFELNDTTGNAIQATGANAVQGQAENAEYTLDGKKYTSQSNTININNDKVQITLKKADNKEIKLSIGTDTNGIENDIKKFVENYNNTVNLATQYADQLGGAAKLGSEFENIVNSRKNTLANIGITINDDNTLEIDEKKLSAALSTNSSYVKDVFSGSRGIADKVYSKANEVMSSPLKYSQPNMTNASSDSNYNDIFASNGILKNSPGLYNGMIIDMML